MRSSRVPERLEFWDEPPYTETGKLSRRRGSGASDRGRALIAAPMHSPQDHRLTTSRSDPHKESAYRTPESGS